MIDFYTDTAIGAFFRIDDVGLLSLDNGSGRAFVKAAAALDAIFGNFIDQIRAPLIWL
jgi:hypothetical protein